MIIHLSVCVFSLDQKLTRQEDQKLFLTLYAQIFTYYAFEHCSKIHPLSMLNNKLKLLEFIQHGTNYSTEMFSKVILLLEYFNDMQI